MNFRNVWAIIAVLGALAFLIVILTHAPGVAFLIVAIVLAAAYSVAALMSRGED